MDFLALFADVPIVAIVLFGIGVVLLIVEMCVPGFGVAGITSLIVFALAIIFAADTFLEGLIFTGIVLLVAAAIIVVFLVFLSKGKFSPNFILKAKTSSEEGFSSAASDWLLWLVLRASHKRLCVLPEESGLAIRFMMWCPAETISPLANPYVWLKSTEIILSLQQRLSDYHNCGGLYHGYSHCHCHYFCCFIVLALFFSFVPVALWISALAANVHVGILTLVGMRLRRVVPSRIVNPLIKRRKPASTFQLISWRHIILPAETWTVWSMH